MNPLREYYLIFFKFPHYPVYYKWWCNKKNKRLRSQAVFVNKYMTTKMNKMPPWSQWLLGLSSKIIWLGKRFTKWIKFWINYHSTMLSIHFSILALNIQCVLPIVIAYQNKKTLMPRKNRPFFNSWSFKWIKRTLSFDTIEISPMQFDEMMFCQQFDENPINFFTL